VFLDVLQNAMGDDVAFDNAHPDSRTLDFGGESL
jgi:hypothetical protein